MDDFYFSDDDDDVFGMKDVSKDLPVRSETKTLEPQNTLGGVSEDANNSYDALLAGNSKSSFPCMAMDYTFNHVGLDVCPRVLPTMTKRSKEKARKELDNSDENNAAATLSFVIDAWKSGNSDGRREKNAIAKWKSGTRKGTTLGGIRRERKGSFKKMKDVDVPNGNQVSVNSLAMGSSESSLKTANKWKTLRSKNK